MYRNRHKEQLNKTDKNKITKIVFMCDETHKKINKDFLNNLFKSLHDTHTSFS